jgi:hypothetical protein
MPPAQETANQYQTGELDLRRKPIDQWTAPGDAKVQDAFFAAEIAPLVQRN